jgi:hypothetical protein
VCDVGGVVAVGQQDECAIERCEMCATMRAAVCVRTTVAAVMGEMGGAFDGGNAEDALLPNPLLMPIATPLAWDVLAALTRGLPDRAGRPGRAGRRAG